MSPLLVAVLLLSALLHASWNAILKGGPERLFEMTLNTCGAGLLGLAALLFLPFPAAAAWPCILASAAIHLAYNLLLVAAYRDADLGYAYTLMRGSAPLVTSLVTVGLLGEEIGAGGWAGVLLLSVGILVLTRDSFRARGDRGWRPTLVALANALAIVSYTVVDGRGARLSGHSVSYACWLFFLNVFPLLAVSLVRRGGALAAYARVRWPYGLAGGACSFAAYGAAVYAMAHAPIALVAALRETSVLFGMLLGVWFLGERLTPLRAIAVLFVAAGAMCIRFA